MAGTNFYRLLCDCVTPEASKIYTSYLFIYFCSFISIHLAYDWLDFYS